MNRSVYSLLVVLLAVIAPPTAAAQVLTSNADDVIPWFNLKLTRVQTPFQSIVGLPGAQMITGSDNADALSGTFPLQLPFTVHLFGNHYPAGHNLYVGVAGFVGFDNALSSCSWPYVLMPDPSYRHLIMPYWSDLKTTAGTGQGVYYRIDIDSNATFHDSTLTIEWDVQTMTAPLGSGRFQLRLTQVPQSSAGTQILANCFTAVEFDYDEMSSLARSTASGSYGAVVGLKDSGQGLGIPGPPKNAGEDDAKYLIPTFPGAVPQWTSITRLPTRVPYGCTSCTPVPDWYACNTVTPSEYFHYDVPDSSYRMKPIDADNIIIKDPPVSLFIPRESVDALNFHVYNNGISVQTDVPVTVVIAYYDSVIYVHTDSIGALGVGTVDSISVPMQTELAGEYHVTASVWTAADENHGNDTARLVYWVSPTHDAMTLAITSPSLVDRPGPRRYFTGSPISVTATIANSGTVLSPITTGYVVRDTADSTIARDVDSLGEDMSPGSGADHTFDTFTIDRPGFYYVDVFTHAASDEIPSNDTIRSAPSWNGTADEPAAGWLRPAPVPFEVVYPVDLAVNQPAYYAHLPRTGESVHRSTKVMEMFINNGGLDAGDVEVHARITDSDGTTVYDRTDTLDTLAATPRAIMHFFRDFTPPVSGTYCVTVWITRDTRDSVPANDTARWCFDAVVDPPGRRGERSSGDLSELEGGSSGNRPASAHASEAEADERVRPAYGGYPRGRKRH